MGIVAHWLEHKNPQFKKFVHALPRGEFHEIKVRGYKNWRDFIAQICGSEFVVSSSLHGIIVAEAYRIPCLWVAFHPSKTTEDECFKYRDFYLSIGKNIPRPVLISPETPLEELKSRAKKWTPGKIDLAPLIKACPFPLKFT